MSVNEETYHIINSYLSGKLTGRALDKFKIDLRNDASLREAVVTQRSIIKAVETAKEKELKSFITSEVNKTRAIPYPKMRGALASAAVIAILAIVIFTLAPISHKRNNNTAQEEQKKPLMVARDNAPDTILESAETIYRETTQVDTQTFARVESAPILELEPEVESIEDDHLDMSGMDTIEESIGLDFEDDIADKADRYDINKKPTKLAGTSSKLGKTTTKDIDLIVRSDELLGKKSYPVYAAALNPLDRTTNVGEVTIQANNKLSRKERKAKNKKEAEDNSSRSRSTVTRSIMVEYWQSVVNYKGYQYDGTQVKLYGVNQLKSLRFVELDNRLYLKLNSEQYFLEKNTKHNRLIQVTNPTLLKVLNE